MRILFENNKTKMYQTFIFSDNYIILICACFVTMSHFRHKVTKMSDILEQRKWEMLFL